MSTQRSPLTPGLGNRQGILGPLLLQSVYSDQNLLLHYDDNVQTLRFVRNTIRHLYQSFLERQLPTLIQVSGTSYFTVENSN